VLVCALAAPLAWAAPTTLFRGAVSADENSKFTFKVLKNKKGKRRVDVPKAKRVNAQCEAGPQEIDATFGSLRNAKIAGDGSFNFDNSGGDYVAYVRGRITGKSARGALRFQGPTEYEGTDTQLCDTGEVKWTAKKAATSRPPSRGAQSGESSPSASLAARR
jgi:hypothetical protein